LIKTWYVGDRIPAFFGKTSSNPKFHFDSMAGRYLIISLMGSASIEKNAAIISHISSYKDRLDDEFASYFIVSVDSNDQSTGRIKERLPGIRCFWDFDSHISQFLGAMENMARPGEPVNYYSSTLILDPNMRVLAHIPMLDVARHNKEFDRVFSSLPPVELHAGVQMHAPVLIVPRVFEPEFCQQLIEAYKENGGEDSGFMREIGGKTVGVMDHTFKRRKDFLFDSEHPLAVGARRRFISKLIPEIKRAFEFQVTRMERYIVACYDDASQGFFRAHRDNTTKATAHRRFACTINLNAEEYEGGDLCFPEFGTRTYRAPTGGAVIFSCSLLHEALPVTKGTRYAFLPFFYDETAAKIREQNLEHLSKEVVDLRSRKLGQ
jgi:hypothetical protein